MLVLAPAAVAARAGIAGTAAANSAEMMTKKKKRLWLEEPTEESKAMNSGGSCCCYCWMMVRLYFRLFGLVDRLEALLHLDYPRAKLQRHADSKQKPKAVINEN